MSIRTDHGGSQGSTQVWRAVVVVAVLAALVAVGLGLYADFDALGRALVSFRWAWFPGALGLTFLNYLLRFWRWQRYLAALEIEIPARRSFSIYLAGQTMTISPAKLGEVLKSALLRRSFGVPVPRSAPIVLVERVGDAIGIVLLVAVAAVWAGAGESWEVAAAALLGALAVVVAVRAPYLSRFPRLAEAREAAVRLLGVGLLAGMSLLAAASWFCECLAAYVCVRGLGLHVSLPETVLLFSLGSLAGALSFLPGGLGVAETSMTGLLRVLGDVPKADAAAATVLIRLATLWFAVVLGLVALAVEERLERRARYDSPEPEPERRSSIR